MYILDPIICTIVYYTITHFILHRFIIHIYNIVVSNGDYILKAKLCQYLFNPIR